MNENAPSTQSVPTAFRKLRSGPMCFPGSSRKCFSEVTSNVIDVPCLKTCEVLRDGARRRETLRDGARRCEKLRDGAR